MQYYLTEPGRKNRVVSEYDIRTAAFITTGKRLSDDELDDYINQLQGIERELTEKETEDPFTLIKYGATDLAMKILYHNSDTGMTLTQAYRRVKSIEEEMNGGRKH